MTISKEDALQYVPDSNLYSDFCWVGSIFSLISYNKNNPEKVMFHYYGLIEDITWDTQSDFKWKRINVDFFVLNNFPPTKAVLNMQIHHIIIGKYTGTDSENIFEIVPLNRMINLVKQEVKKQENIDSKFLAFKKKKS